MTDTTQYSPALIPAARTLAARGALDKDLAAAFGVPFKTIREWRQRHPDFAAACRLPRDAADAAVERALFRKATGYDRETERVVLKDDELVRTTVTEHVPPCDKAATFWLRVRRPDRWGVPPPVAMRPENSELTPTEETLRDIEGQAYDAWCAAVDGEPEMEGDGDMLTRIDALGLADAPADDADPVQNLETLSESRGSPLSTASPLPVRFERSREPLSSAVEKSRGALAFARGEFSTSLEPKGGEGTGCRDGGPRVSGHDTLPHRIHPPLPALITAPFVEPVDADPSPAPASRYDPACIPLARHLAEQGALDRDLARAFGVTVTTIRQWELRHAVFGQAMRLAKSVADDAVEGALFARATGYSYIREKILWKEDGETVRTRILVEQPPSLPAALFWLSRRTDHRWSLNRPPDLDPADAAKLVAETRARVADYDLHRRHWRTHGCAPPDRDAPEPPLWLWDEGLTTDDKEDDGGWDEEKEEDFRARVDAFLAARMRGRGCE